MADAPSRITPNEERGRANALSSARAKDRNNPPTNPSEELNQEPEGYSDLTQEEPAGGRDKNQGDKMAAQGRERNIQNQLNSDRLKNFVQNLQRWQRAEENASFDVGKFSDENGVDMSPEMMTTEEGAQSLDPREKVRSKMYKHGFELRNRILTGDFKAFYLALSLAIIADFPPIIATLAGINPGILASLIFWIVAPLLWYIRSFSGTFFQRLFMKRFFGQFIMNMMAENFPVVGDVYPGYTISVLLIKRYADKEKKKHKRVLEELGINYKKLFGDDLFSAKGFIPGMTGNVNLKRRFGGETAGGETPQKSPPPRRPEMAPQSGSSQPGGARKPPAPASSGQSLPLAA